MSNATSLRRFLVLWTGQLFSGVGTGMSAFALGVHVFRTTGTATGLAVAGVSLSLTGTTTRIVPLTAALPLVNTGAEVLIRTAVSNEQQGRGMGFILVLAGIFLTVLTAVIAFNRRSNAGRSAGDRSTRSGAPAYTHEVIR